MSTSSTNDYLTQQHNDDTHQIQLILSSIIGAVIYCIYLPICFYGIYQYHKHKEWIVMKKRYQWITVYILINLVLTLILLPILSIDIIINNNNFRNTLTIEYISYAIIILAVNILWKMTWRLWMYYYDIKWSYCIANKEWKTLIDSACNQKDWFLQNKNKFGKWQYWHKIYFLIVLFNFIFITMWSFIPFSNAILQNIVFLIAVILINFLPISIITYLRFKTPLFDDNFAIKEETKYVLYTVSGGIFCIMIFCIISFLISDALYRALINLLIIFVLATMYCIIFYITTIWVVHRNESWLSVSMNNYQSPSKELMHLMRSRSISQKQQKVNNHLVVVNGSPSSPSLSYSGSPIAVKTKMEKPKQLTLKQVLSEEGFLNVFMIHLSQEFSMEIILSLIEMDQFQRCILSYYQQKFDKDVSQKFDRGTSPWMHSKDWVLELYFVEFAKSIPLSSIVYGDLMDECEDEMIGFCVRACELYSKYIKLNAEYEINISARLRNELANDLDNFEDFVHRWTENYVSNDEIEDGLLYLFNLFKRPLNVMYRLLGYSYSRFRQNPAFQRLAT